MSVGDLQAAIDRAARDAVLHAMADLELARGSQVLVSGMAGVARVLDMSRSKLHRLRAAATRTGIPFPEPALYSGLGGTKSYWLKDVEGWIRDVGAAEVNW